MCAVDGCLRSPKRPGGRYCSMHTERLRRNGEVGPAESRWESAAVAVCAAPGCDRKPRSMAAEYCRMHDERWRRHGSLDKPKHHALIDEKRCSECGYQGPDFYSYLKSKCIPCYRAYQRAYDRRYKERRGYSKTLEWSLRKRYGISLDDYRVLLEAQGGVCAICEMPPEAGYTRLHVDHCHETGAVRGLLCSGCNRALGFLSDNPRNAERAAMYLDAHQSAVASGAYRERR